MKGVALQGSNDNLQRCGQLLQPKRHLGNDISLAWSLSGFNLGIEVAQVCVALGVALGSVLLARLAGPASPNSLAHAASVFGIVAGTWWFVERTGAWV